MEAPHKIDPNNVPVQLQDGCFSSDSSSQEDTDDEDVGMGSFRCQTRLGMREDIQIDDESDDADSDDNFIVFDKASDDANSDDSFIVFDKASGDEGESESEEEKEDDDEDDKSSKKEMECEHEDTDGACNLPSVKVSTKKVRFAEDKVLCDVHRMIKWSYAYQAARKGPWEVYARDRDRFKRRIADAGRILKTVFQPAHRNQVFSQRFASPNILMEI